MSGPNDFCMAKPKHLAISLEDISDWCRKNNASLNAGCERYFTLLKRLLELQIKIDIPIFTIYLLQEPEKIEDDHILFLNCMNDFFNELSDSKLISDNRVKISMFGKWYELPGKSVESLKNIIERTKEYDNFFVNFCVNYDGQEEIVDSCKLIAKQVELGKIDPAMITKETIKENIYASYFLPPDIMLIYGESRLTGLLLWDSAKTYVSFVQKSFMEFEEHDIENLNHNLFK